MSAKRILVTGSRDWRNEIVVKQALEDAYVLMKALDPVCVRNCGVTLVHGACPTGADAMADRLWGGEDRYIERHPADWSIGRRAGPQRNLNMVSLGADLCLAFIGDCTSPRCTIPWTHESHGASGCAALAEKAGINVWYYYE